MPHLPALKKIASNKRTSVHFPQACTGVSTHTHTTLNHDVSVDVEQFSPIVVNDVLALILTPLLYFIHTM